MGGGTISKWDASYMQNKKSYSKESNVSRGGKQKGNKKSDSTDAIQNKNSKDTKNDQNANQNKNASRYCSECKMKSHWNATAES